MNRSFSAAMSGPLSSAMSGPFSAAMSGLFPAGSLRVRREEFFAELLVPDRAVLAHAFPQVSVERASVDAYLSLYMKGAQL